MTSPEGRTAPDGAVVLDDVDDILAESPVFATLDPTARELVAAALEPRTLRGGETLMSEGDEADALYVVASGRLRVTRHSPGGGTEVLAEIGRGELVGEMAMIAETPRSATVHAVRDTHLLRLSTDAFTHLVGAHPEALRAITTQIVQRLLRSQQAPRPTSPVACVAVVPLSPGVDDFPERLTRALGRHRPLARTVRHEEAVRDLGPAPSADRLAAWCGALEHDHDVVVYAANPDVDEWTEACIRQADTVIFAVTANAAVELRDVEALVERRPAAVSPRVELVLVHPPNTPVPRGTQRWVTPRRIHRHHHVRAGRDADVERVARLLVGRGVGLVFSGGGARGIAELGVLRALLEAGVPIDAVGGTSMGSIIAAGVARELGPDELARLVRLAVLDGRSPVDLTLPAVSIASGGRITAYLQHAADGVDLEDCWRDVFCVSTNLTRGCVEVHRRGPVWLALRASFSIPGVFPPVRSNDGDLLVDGGVLDNLPVTEMRRGHYGIQVVAIDTGSRHDLTAGSLPGMGVVSGWRYMLSRLDPRTPNHDTAGMPRILMRLTELGAAAVRDTGDLYIRPPVEGVGLLDFGEFDRLIEDGYRAGVELVGGWLDDADTPRW